MLGWVQADSELFIPTAAGCVFHFRASSGLRSTLPVQLRIFRLNRSGAALPSLYSLAPITDFPLPGF